MRESRAEPTCLAVFLFRGGLAKKNLAAQHHAAEICSTAKVSSFSAKKLAARCRIVGKVMSEFFVDRSDREQLSPLTDVDGAATD
jgi:hypothetical protein